MNRQRMLARCAAILLAGAVVLPLSTPFDASAQSGRKPPEKARPQSPGAPPESPTEKRPRDQQTPDTPGLTPEDLKGSIQLNADIVNVETVVYEKKSGRILQNLKASNFKLYEDGVEQEIANFTGTEGPITMVLLLEFSKRVDNQWFSKRQILEPAYTFISQFAKPEDNIAIVAFDMRPKVIVDFTGNSHRLVDGIRMLSNNYPAFNESNVYDALKFVLKGGELDGEQYQGLEGVNRRSAIVLVTLGIDTFSKINYDETLRIVGSAGVPIYPIGIGKLWYKINETRLPPELNLQFLQADNMLKSFARMTGGQYYPITFSTEIPTDMQSIANTMRNQYSIGYTPTNQRREGKQRKIVLKVDVDGDGKFEDKDIVVQHRQVYVEPRDAKKK